MLNSTASALQAAKQPHNHPCLNSSLDTNMSTTNPLRYSVSPLNISSTYIYKMYLHMLIKFFKDTVGSFESYTKLKTDSHFWHYYKINYMFSYRFIIICPCNWKYYSPKNLTNYSQCTCVHLFFFFFLFHHLPPLHMTKK